jgi:hypothetical protein
MRLSSPSPRLSGLTAIQPPYNAIHPACINHNEVSATKIHKITPCSIGRTPTCRTVAREIPVPIKYKVAVNPSFPITLNTCHAPASRCK